MSDLPPALVDRELEVCVLSAAFGASRLSDENPEHKAALSALASFRRMDPALFGCRDLRQVARASHTVLGNVGVLDPLAVRDELRRGHAWDELRVVLPAVVAGSGLVGAMGYYIARLDEIAGRRREYLVSLNRAADLLVEQVR